MAGAAYAPRAAAVPGPGGESRGSRRPGRGGGRLASGGRACRGRAGGRAGRRAAGGANGAGHAGGPWHGSEPRCRTVNWVPHCPQEDAVTGGSRSRAAVLALGVAVLIIGIAPAFACTNLATMTLSASA